MAELLGVLVLAVLVVGLVVGIFAPRRRDRSGRSLRPGRAGGVLDGVRQRGLPQGGDDGDRAGGAQGAGGAPGSAGTPDPSDAPGRSAGSGGGPTAQAAALAEDLTRAVRRAKAAGGRLPVAAVPAVRDVEDVVRPLLTYLQARPGSPEELRQATAIVRDHLDDALDRYLALPADYLATARTPEGRTVAEELVDQLRLLHEGAQQLARAVYDGDAAQLAVGRRFLDAKFRRSDLDL